MPFFDDLDKLGPYRAGGADDGYGQVIHFTIIPLSPFSHGEKGELELL